MTNEQSVIDAGFKIYQLSSGLFAIADPQDNEDGFYLEGDNEEELVNAAFDYIKGDGLKDYEVVIAFETFTTVVKDAASQDEARAKALLKLEEVGVAAVGKPYINSVEVSDD